MDKQTLLDNLAIGPVTVTFTKRDGTERVMTCTRNINMIPLDKAPKGESGKLITENTDNIKVFDIQIQEWRSFNFSTLKETK